MNSSPGSRFTWGPVILIGALGVLTGCPGSLEGPLDDYPNGGGGGGGTVTGSGGSGTVIPPGTGGSVVIPPGTGGATVTGTGGSVSGTGGQGTGGSVSGTGGQGTGGRGTGGSTTTGTGGSTTTGTGGRGTGGSTTTGTGGTTAGTGGRGTGGATTGTGGRGGSGTGGAGAGGTTATTWTEIYTTMLNNSAYASNCAGAACHNPGTKKNVNLATKATGYTSVRAIVTPGSPTAGTLYRVLNSGSMPETRPKMPAADLAKIQSWISAGALDN